MCVILVVETVRPTPSMVQACWDANGHGGGVSWQEDGKVKWKKGITDLEKMIDLAATLPLPFIQHFRIASVGGVHVELTHPFLMNHSASLELEGESETDYVLFHNGSWHEWKTFVLKASFDCKVPLPDGKWSDSRAMAFLGSIYGKNICEMINEKIVIMSKDDMQFFWGGGWTEVEGVWCSNEGFKHRMRTRADMCEHGKCTQSKVYKSKYCYLHTKMFEDDAKEGEVVEQTATNPTGGVALASARTTPVLIKDGVFNPGQNGSTPNITLPLGGGDANIPFRVLMAAQHQAATGVISNKEYKKIRKIFERNPIELAQVDMIARLGKV